MTGRPRSPIYPFFQSWGRWCVRTREEKIYVWSRVVMWNELGHEVEPELVVHHINGNRTDDRPENLQVLTRSDHARVHRDQITHCQRGHPFDKANTIHRSSGNRTCRTCKAAADKACKAR